MCLSIVTKTFKPNNNMRFGYKVFTNSYKNLDAYYSHVYTVHVPRMLGRVYTAVMIGSIISEDTHQPYDTGFHIWSTLKGAQKDCLGCHDCIVKVIAWDIRAYGQNRTNSYDERKMACFVAKNIRLMEEIEEGGDLCV